MNLFCPLLYFKLDFKAASGKQKATPILADKIEPRKNTFNLQRQHRSLKKYQAAFPKYEISEQILP